MSRDGDTRATYKRLADLLREREPQRAPGVLETIEKLFAAEERLWALRDVLKALGVDKP